MKKLYVEELLVDAALEVEGLNIKQVSEEKRGREVTRTFEISDNSKNVKVEIKSVKMGDGVFEDRYFVSDDTDSKEVDNSYVLEF